MNFKEQRQKLGLSQAYVAEKVGIALSSYQLIEKNVTKNPKPENIQAIKKVLKMEDRNGTNF